jgi:hypothetical protein
MDVEIIRTLVFKQQQLQSKIETTIENLKKISAEKQNAKGLKPFIESLTSLYRTFANNYSALVNAGGASNEYKKKYDQTIEEYSTSVRLWANKFISDSAEKWPTMDQILAEPNPSRSEPLSQLINLEKPSRATQNFDIIPPEDSIQTDQPPVQAEWDWADQLLVTREEAATDPTMQNPSEKLQALQAERDHMAKRIETMKQHYKQIEQRLSDEISKTKDPTSNWTTVNTYANATNVLQRNHETSKTSCDEQPPNNFDQSKIPNDEAHSKLSNENSVINSNAMAIIAQTLQKLTDKTLSNAASTQPSTNFRIPELNLQPFSGNYKDWKPFKIAIEATLANSRFTDNEKFSFLRSKLTGPALDEIQDMDFQNENYTTAMQMLESRFSNPNRVIRDLINKFQAVKEDPPEKASSYLKIIRTFKATSINLNHLGPEGEEKWKTLFMVTTTLSMFSSATIDRWNDWFSAKGTQELQGQRFPSLAEILYFIEKEYSRALEIEASRKQNSSKSIAFVSSEEKHIKCFACGENHICTNCPLFLAATNKMEFLIKHKVCIKCAKHKYNRNKPCRLNDQLICCECSGKHLTILCPSKRDHRNLG